MVGTLHFAFFRPLMRFPKKSLIRDSAVDFCVAKIAASANQVFAAQKAVRLSALAPCKKRHRLRGWVRCVPEFSERRGRLTENFVYSRLRSPQRLRAVAAATANQVFAAQKAVRLSALAPNINRHPFGCLFMFGGRGWIRTTEAEKQQIYSLPPLATRELAHIKLELVMGLEPATC